MFTDPPRDLQFPLDRAAALDALTPAGEEVCGLPAFPEDSDERITVLFRLSLNEFVALASAVDAGSDVAYGADAVKIWWLWVANVMCASFCEEMAACLTDQNEALMAALADVLANNPALRAAIGAAVTEEGGAIPGRPLTSSQSAADTLPANVKPDDECDNNALWGACLFLVQSGNRAITDVFEDIEAASNTLETTAIVSETIPAAGPYAAAAVEFADQLQENLTEGYAAAYTETYEEDLACAIFCAARDADCTLTVDMLVDIINNRLPDPDDMLNFGLVMARIGTGTFSGQEIADAAFLIYFTALKFGQQFGQILGIRPLTDLMSLGADQLASDNWEVLCDCPVVCTEPNFVILDPIGYPGGTVMQTDNMDGTFTILWAAAQGGPDNAWRLVSFDANLCCWRVVSIDYSITPENLTAHYECGANPTNPIWYAGLAEGSLEVGECYGGIAGSSVSSFFTVTAVIELCD